MSFAFFFANVLCALCIEAKPTFGTKVLTFVRRLVTLALAGANYLGAFKIGAFLANLAKALALVVTLALTCANKLFAFKVGAIATLFANAHASVNPLAVKNGILCNCITLEIPR